MSDYRIFLVPYDFSPHARAALAASIDLGRRLDAELHLVHVVQTPTYAHDYGGLAGAHSASVIDMSDVRSQAANTLKQDTAVALGDYPAHTLHVLEGLGIADTIRAIADKLSADLIIMGTHGRTGLAHVFLGSVAERTLRQAPCPVLTVRAAEDEE